jgi:hypothetical protein
MKRRRGGAGARRRYHASGRSGAWGRAGYALAATVITRDARARRAASGAARGAFAAEFTATRGCPRLPQADRVGASVAMGYFTVQAKPGAGVRTGDQAPVAGAVASRPRATDHDGLGTGRCRGQTIAVFVCRTRRPQTTMASPLGHTQATDTMALGYWALQWGRRSQSVVCPRARHRQRWPAPLGHTQATDNDGLWATGHCSGQTIAGFVCRSRRHISDGLRTGAQAGHG